MDFPHASTERGLGYGVVNGNERVYVVSRTLSLSVQVLNANTGVEVNTLSTTGVTGGTIVLNDIGVTTDGVIIGCNLTTTSATSAFICYRWSSENAAPAVAFSQTIAGPGATNYRFGDKITVTGSTADNTAAIWIASANGASSDATTEVVYKLTTADLGTTFTPTLVTTTTTNNTFGNTPSVAPEGGSSATSWYVKGAGVRPVEYTGNTLTSTASNVPTGASAIRYFARNSREFIATHTYVTSGIDAALNTGQAAVYEVSGDATGTLYATTPDQATNSNANGTGDVEVRDNGNSTYTFFVLTTNNGIGAYTSNASPLPVELTAFEAAATVGGALLRWSTASETNNARFVAERQQGTAWVEVGSRAGAGTSAEQQHYTLTVQGLTPGAHRFRLRQIDLDGTTTLSSVVEAVVMPGAALNLSAARPSPFEGATQTLLSVQTAQRVRVVLFDALGRQQAVVFDGDVSPAAPRALTVSGTNLAPGVYVLRAEGAGHTATTRLVRH